MRDMEKHAESKHILTRVFSDKRFVHPEFFSWLYDQNPVGGAICITHTGIAHFACIPQQYIQGTTFVETGLVLNAAVTQSMREKGIFRQLLLQMIDETGSAGMTHILAVTNNFSTNAFLKYGGFQLIKPLPVRIGFFLKKCKASKVKEIPPEDIKLSQNIRADYEQHWTNSIAQWRLAAPHRQYRTFTRGETCIVIMETHYAKIKVGVILKVWTSSPLSSHEINSTLREIAGYLKTPFLLYGGFNKNFTMRGINIPRKLLPSPLNLLVKSLNATSFKLSVFELLDFDGY